MTYHIKCIISKILNQFTNATDELPIYKKKKKFSALKGNPVCMKSVHLLKEEIYEEYHQKT